MTDGLRGELSRLLSDLGGDLVCAVGIKGANDRVDAVTMICRDALRRSSLCLVDGAMHRWDGRLYVPCRRRDVLDVLGNILVDMGVSPTDVRRMGEMPLSVVTEKSFARDAGLLCFDNGVLRLPDGWSDGYDARRIVTEYLPYSYSPAAACPLWEAFLAEVLPDASVRMVLQEFLGLCYADRGAMSVEKFAIFIGEGANGKSVIRDVVTGMMGADNVAAYDAQQLTQEKMLPFLVGKRINFASDMRSSASFDSALKALSSGQEVVGRKIYEDPVKVKCPPIVFSMNALPDFCDTSPAFFRRVLLFRFGVVIPEGRRDASLADRICRSELAGVLNWALEGRRRLVAQGGRFTPSPKMDADLALLRGDVLARANPVRTYLEGRGYSIRPLFEGQRPVRVSCRDLADALPSLSVNAIARELTRLGVRGGRSRETYYEVYRKEDADGKV